MNTNNMGQCEYCVKRGQKLLRCQSRANQTVYLEGETIKLCPTHAAVVTRLLARKEKLDRYFAEVSRQIAEEERKITDAYRELQEGG